MDRREHVGGALNSKPLGFTLACDVLNICLLASHFQGAVEGLGFTVTARLRLNLVRVTWRVEL